MPPRVDARYAPSVQIDAFKAVSPDALRREVTIDEWLAVPEKMRHELIDGHMVAEGMRGFRHGRAQLGVGSCLRELYDCHPGGARKPGGWWISLGVDLYIGGIGCRPDLVGWRRGRFPRFPAPDARGLVTDVPDWICEVVSSSSRRIDWGAKRLAYHRAGVAAYWLLDADNENLAILQRFDESYQISVIAEKHQSARALPFGARELAVCELLGQEAEEPTTVSRPDPQPILKAPSNDSSRRPRVR